jgi:hypothetical protein
LGPISPLTTRGPIQEHYRLKQTLASYIELTQPKIKPDAPDSFLDQDASCLKISDDG